MTPFDLRSLLRPELAELQPYLPHTGHYEIRLDANEAPPMLSQEALERLSQAAAATSWHRYPDATQEELRRAIAQRCGARPEEVLVGVGSDELITLLLTVLTRPKAPASEAVVLTATPTFVMYRSSARARGLRVAEVPLDSDWDLDEEASLRALEEADPNVVFLASPNNPTGTMITPARLARFVEAARRALVVVDEAYVDYADRDQLALLRQYDNVAILRTLSKVGFAALRVGWLLGRPDLVAELDKARLPYNIPSPCQSLAALALTELSGEIDATCRAVVTERRRLEEAVGALPGIRLANSQANFLWLETERGAGELWDALRRHGILVRSFHARGGRLAHCLRVTIGTREENDAFLAAFRETLER
ncbi:MAG: histidinol-phosphate transaminase [Myxococcales bacterium]|nr:histidinol-phosphate transaminase [Myxococcales bacterium]